MKKEEGNIGKLKTLGERTGVPLDSSKYYVKAQYTVGLGPIFQWPCVKNADHRVIVKTGAKDL